MRVINLFKMDTATPAIFMDSINCFINPSVYLNTFHAIHKNIPIYQSRFQQFLNKKTTVHRTPNPRAATVNNNANFVNV